MAQPPSPWTLTNAARTNLVDAADDWRGSFTVPLFLSTSNLGVASTTYGALTHEVAAGNGYTTGGTTAGMTISGTTTVIVYFATNPVWTATAGGITAYSAALIAPSGKVVAYCLLDSTPQNVTVVSNTLTISNTASNPIATLQ